MLCNAHNLKNKINFLPKISMSLFNILNTIDSTNNYAMGRIHAGLAQAGEAWFAEHQTQGKGQRGKHWISKPKESILMTVIMQPSVQYELGKFTFSAQVANICADWMEEIYGVKVKIKWPNDLYINDRKAGGILIENSVQGTTWKWAVVGIGINVNQEMMVEVGQPATSIYVETGKKNDVISGARRLHQSIIDEIETDDAEKVMTRFNSRLLKRYDEVLLMQGEDTFLARIYGVNEWGQLVTDKGVYRHGEVEWLK